MIQDENAILDDPSDRASHYTPMPSHPSVGADLSVSRRTPNDVFPTIMYMPYKPNNYHVDFDRIKIHPVIRAILKGHPLAPALSYCADVPEVYLQQAWNTITKNELARPHRFEFQVDQFESFLSYKRLRLILELPEPNSRPGRTTYDSFPSEEEVYEGIQNLGYVGTLNKPTDFDKSNLPPVWYALFSVLIRCLTSKHSGTDSASLLYLRLFHAVVYDLHVEYTFIFWTELSEVVHDKFTNKKRKFIPFVRFMKLIVRSMLHSNPSIPRRLSWPQVPDSEMSYIQKQKKTFNYSMTIPYALIANYADVSNEDVIEYYPYGVVYKNGSSQKCFLRFEEIAHYSDGTLKMIKLQLEQRLKEAQRRFLETRSEAFLVDNDEIRLLNRTLNTIYERLNLRSSLRRLEVLVGLNRLRQREERQ
ncbi:hypothetical protein L6452_09366 [Arctium lappa]|uniref:Uncharacterized protein n=1 Tax=Arctium lappa TaxID=4217 RepID=A0ACB9DJU9_ARCLA|nr:hypothetical protein L6452_09366 [Arctium lappa]